MASSVVLGAVLCLLSASVHPVHTARTKAQVCASFASCASHNIVCESLFRILTCENIPKTTTPQAPKCGLSVVTGPASMYHMPRIVGGIDALDGEFPWTVFLQFDQSINLCGGIVLDADSVLTAAHCVDSYVTRPNSVRVGYGAVNRTALTYIRASKVTRHPLYNATNQDNDVAVITLTDPLPLTVDLPPLCLPEYATAYTTGRTCITTGWGTTRSGGFRTPETLQKVEVPLVPRDLCETSYMNIPRVLVSERQLCAGFYLEGGKDACQGDSGGPLMCADGDRWVLQGVVSVGEQCALSRFPGVYAFVPYHVAWIRQQL